MTSENLCLLKIHLKSLPNSYGRILCYWVIDDRRIDIDFTVEDGEVCIKGYYEFDDLELIDDLIVDYRTWELQHKLKKRNG